LSGKATICGSIFSSDQKGSIAETAIIHAAVKLGIDVYKPVSDGTRYDLIFDVGQRLIRVQCKWVRRYGDVLIVRSYSNRRARDGLVKRVYTAHEIDALALYCAELDSHYFLPIEFFDGQSQIHLRLACARNKQTAGVHLAEEFEFDATLGNHGAVAQLGERLAGSQKAAGSSPAGST
jgi:hypothetical protein